MVGPRGGDSPDSDAERGFETLAALRAELGTARRVRPGRLIGIARSTGLTEFPAGFLVAGELRDLSPGGPRAKLRRIAARRESIPHPLFSPEFYRATNPDVAATGISPWLHYQLHGRGELRSPHPLIDPSYLAAALPGVATGSVLDRYLGTPELWLTEPGPYIDCQRFMLYGDWDRTTNPLVQIASTRLDSHWIHPRLMLVDTATDDQTRARLTGAGFLFLRAAARGELASLHVFDRIAGPTVGSYTVVPGLFVGNDGHEVAAIGSGVVSDDATVIRLATETLAVRTGKRSSAAVLVIIDGPLDRDELLQLVTSLDETAAIAPSSPAQQDALRALCGQLDLPRVTVLEHGVQVQVAAARHQLVRAASQPTIPTPSWPDVDNAGSAVVVLSAGSRLRATNDPRIASLLAAGAALSLVDEHGLSGWLPIIQNRSSVLVEARLYADVASFVPAPSLSVLPTEGM